LLPQAGARRKCLKGNGLGTAAGAGLSIRSKPAHSRRSKSPCIAIALLPVGPPSYHPRRLFLAGPAKDRGPRLGVREDEMNTIKSAAVLLVLAGVLYGVYTALNKPEPAPPPGMTAQHVDQLGPPHVEIAPPSTLAPSTLPPPVASLPAPPTSLAATAESSPADLTPADSAEGSAYRRSNYEVPARAETEPGSGSDSVAPADVALPETSPPAASAASPTVNALSFRRDLDQAEQHVAAGKFKSALATLSPYYSLSDLVADERQQLLAWLDALAAKVIYSREHLLDSPHVVQGKNESLYDLSDKYHVPWQLLANINDVKDPQVLLPGTELKVVPGPMRAEVSLTAGEITIFLGNLYAGRFPFSLGDVPPQAGEYRVLDKRRDRTFYGNDGRTIPANDPTNPYGNWWLDLGREACIHGSPATPSERPLGCISLSPQDAKDVYGILIVGSTVSIRQ
jgi:hypothetical protein